MHEIEDDEDELAIVGLPDWIFRPPAGQVDPRALLRGDPTAAELQADEKARRDWEADRAAYLAEDGLPVSYTAESREFWRLMQDERDRRWPVETEPLDGRPYAERLRDLAAAELGEWRTELEERVAAADVTDAERAELDGAVRMIDAEAAHRLTELLAGTDETAPPPE